MISSPMSVWNGLIPRERISTAAAPISPNTAPEAPTVSACGVDQERAERAPQQRREVQRGEAAGPEQRLEHLPQDPQQVHVEADVEEASVQEAAGDQPPVLAVVRPPGRCSAKSFRSRLLAEPVKPIDPVARNATAQTMMIPTVTRGSLRIVRMVWTFVRCLRALRAAHADRRRRHAVGADRPPAGRAGDARLAVGMAVAGLGGGAGRGGVHLPANGTTLRAAARRLPAPAGPPRDPPVTRPGR